MNANTGNATHQTTFNLPSQAGLIAGNPIQEWLNNITGSKKPAQPVKQLERTNKASGTQASSNLTLIKNIKGSNGPITISVDKKNNLIIDTHNIPNNMAFDESLALALGPFIVKDEHGRVLTVKNGLFNNVVIKNVNYTANEKKDPSLFSFMLNRALQVVNGDLFYTSENSLTGLKKGMVSVRLVVCKKQVNNSRYDKPNNLSDPKIIVQLSTDSEKPDNLLLGSLQQAHADNVSFTQEVQKSGGFLNTPFGSSTTAEYSCKRQDYRAMNNNGKLEGDCYRTQGTNREKITITSSLGSD
jgi:hypothetical protein